METVGEGTYPFLKKGCGVFVLVGESERGGEDMLFQAFKVEDRETFFFDIVHPRFKVVVKNKL